tara:strand:+ start:92 stop:1288 length:1197 start_codon:yes stop_codon:yes gene_type:complete
MATWKKVIVSGSNISELNNDSNYLSTQGGGILSASVEGAAQGQIKFNGVNVDANALGSGDSPTFVTVTADLTGTADTASYVAGASVDGDVATATKIASITNTNIVQLTGAQTLTDKNLTSPTITGTGNIAGVFTGNLTGNVTGTADTASNVAFDDVVSLTVTSASFDSRIAALSAATYNLGFAGDSGTGEITNAESLTIAGGTNLTSVASGNGLTVNMDADISLTSVTASILGNVIGNVVGNLTGAVTGNADTATTTTGTSTGQGKVTVGTNANIDLGLQTSASPTFVGLTLTGDLTVQGTTTSLQTTNLNVEDQFILINSGGSAADGGLVVNGAGAAIGWDESEGRFALDFVGATFDQTVITADAYIAAVTTTDDANYRKNGNIFIDGSGDINIYVE